MNRQQRRAAAKSKPGKMPPGRYPAVPDAAWQLLMLNRPYDESETLKDNIAIRMTEPRQDALIARRVGTIPLGLYAHPSYIAAHGTPATLAELAHHRLIGFDAETPFLRAAQKALPAWRRDRTARRRRTR